MPRPPARPTAGGSTQAPAPRGWRRRISRTRFLLLGAGLVVVVGFVAYALLFSSWLVVKNVEVEGTTTLTADQVLAAADVDLGVPLARLDTDAVAARVADLREVASVTLHRGWPDTVRITVDERDPALVLTGGDELAVYDLAGVEFMNPGAPPTGVPVLRSDGAPPDAEVVEAVLAVVADLPEAIGARVVEVTAPTIDSIALQLDGDVLVEWGSAEDNARKAQVLTELMKQPATVYNVTAPDVPAVRPLSTPDE